MNRIIAIDPGSVFARWTVVSEARTSGEQRTEACVRIIAIDPGSVTGYAIDDGRSGIWDLTPRKAKKRPPSPADPEESRVGRLCNNVRALIGRRAGAGDILKGERVTVVCEGAASFQRGKAAVRVSHELRGAVKVACWESDARYVEVQPGDLKRFATGSSVADKPQMVAAARQMCGYTGDSDDEADAILLLAWAKAYVGQTKQHVGHPPAVDAAP